MNNDDIRRALSPDDDHWQAPTPAQLAAEFTATPYRIQPDAPRIGGMGAVYRALDTRDAAPVAIKIIRPHLLGRDTFFERFQREEAILRKLDHPNIVRLRDSGETPDGTRYLVMDWVEGPTLTHLTIPGSSKKIETILPLFRDICAAVAHAHASGILHRDLKPENIHLTPDNRAILLDLGIARPFQHDPASPTFTRTGDTLGTHGYQPPEVTERGEKPDHTADIYALGIIFYQLILKRLPAGSVTRPSEEGMAPEYDTIFRKAAAPEKKERYQSAAELLGEVEKLIARSTNTARTLDPKNITIEYEDDWLTIKCRYDNREEIERVFCSEPLATDIIQIFGQPESITSPDSDGQCRYFWNRLGISAHGCCKDIWPWPGSKTRELRISYLVVNLVPNAFRHPSGEGAIGFLGQIAICGVDFQPHLTLEQQVRIKRGKSFAEFGKRGDGKAWYTNVSNNGFQFGGLCLCNSDGDNRPTQCI